MKTKVIRTAVMGASGRMGKSLAQSLESAEDFELVGLADQPDRLETVRPEWRPLFSSDPGAAVASADLVVDFTSPPACETIAGLCASAGAAYLVGSTGLQAADKDALSRASEKIPVLAAANLSLGVNLLSELVEIAARKLGRDFDVEIMEIHHGRKRDAPSGTALTLANAARRGRADLRDLLGRKGLGEPRHREDLGIAALRGGDVAGEHTVFFLGSGERVELTHRATTADIFVAGALRVGPWLVRQQPGMYGMRDFLSLADGDAG